MNKKQILKLVNSSSNGVVSLLDYKINKSVEKLEERIETLEAKLELMRVKQDGFHYKKYEKEWLESNITYIIKDSIKDTKVRNIVLGAVRYLHAIEQALDKYYELKQKDRIEYEIKNKKGETK